MILFDRFARGSLCDPVSALVSTGASLIGGLFGSHAASSAAAIQQAAASQAAQQVKDAAAGVNPAIIQAGKDAGTGVTTAAGVGAADVNAKADQAATDAIAAGKTAGANVVQSATDANKLLNPYVEAGSTAAGVLNTGIADGGEFNKAPTAADITIDPGYAFREQQAQQALERGAAAHGAVDTGGFAKDLNDYVQGSASQEYQAAFNRFETDRQARFGNVATVAGQGQTAATTSGANLIGAEKYAGDTSVGTTEYGGTTRTGAGEFGAGLTTDAAKASGTFNTNAVDLASKNTIDASTSGANFLVGGANAAAAGKVGAANAWSGALSGVASGVNNAIALKQGQNYIDRNSGTPGVTSVFSNGSNLYAGPPGSPAARGVL